MSARRVLDAVFDVLTLVAIVIAAIGHLFDWFDTSSVAAGLARDVVPEAVSNVLSGPRGVSAEQGRSQDAASSGPNAPDTDKQSAEPNTASVRQTMRKVQTWHAGFSAAALGVATLLVFASLLIDWPRTTRKLLVFLIFLALLTALGFQVLVFSSYPLTEMHRAVIDEPWYQYVYPSKMIALAITPTAVAAVLTLVRMVWTMPHLRGKHDSGTAAAATA